MIKILTVFAIIKIKIYRKYMKKYNNDWDVNIS